MRILTVLFLSMILVLVGCGDEGAERDTSTGETVTSSTGKGDTLGNCDIPCGEGASCEYVTVDNRNLSVCIEEGAAGLSCAESYTCGYDCWNALFTCVDTCDELPVNEFWPCHNECYDERRACEGFCRHRLPEAQQAYADYDRCRFDNCPFFDDDDGMIEAEMECMEESCSNVIAACLAN